MNWLQRILRRNQLDRELQEELAAHLALKQQRLERDGVAPEDAARQARHALGSTVTWREETRAQWGFAALESLWQDIRYGLRVLGKDKVFVTVSLLTLALGIGANTAIFTLANALLWKPLPVRDPQELVRLHVTNLAGNEYAWMNGRTEAPKERLQIPYPMFAELSKRQRSFVDLFGVAGHGQVVLNVGDTAHQVRMSVVSESFFPTLGIGASAGRLLQAGDDAPGGGVAGPSLVISDALWTRLFARSPDAVGARVVVEKVPFTIAGVAEPGFMGIHPGEESEVWLALGAFDVMFPDWKWRTSAESWMLQPFGRLKRGVTVEQANQELSVLSRPLLEQVREKGLSGKEEQAFLAMKLEAVPSGTGYSWVRKRFEPAFWMLLGAVGALLLIAATNLTNLLLARATARRAEIAVRLALGASFGRVWRQLLVESALLACGGTVLGLIAAQWLSSGLLRAMAGDGSPIRLNAEMDWRVVLFLIAVLGTVVIIAGVVPAWSGSRGGALSARVQQRESASRGTQSLRAGLIVVHIAFTLVLLGGAGLLLDSLRGLMREPTGFDTAGTVFLTPDLFNAGVSAEAMPAAYERIVEAMRREPGVRAAAWTMHVPLTGTLQAFTIETPAAMALPAQERMVFTHQVTDGYFQATGVPLLAGSEMPSRLKAAQGRRSVIVSENLARNFFGSVDGAIGQRLKPGSEDWAVVIGVAADAKYQHIWEKAPLTVYTNYWDRQKAKGMTLVLRHEPAMRQSVAAAAHRWFRQEAGRLPFVSTRTLEANVWSSLATERTLAWLFTGFGVFALLITATGVAGLLSYTVQLRRKEIGIRLALGATPARIGWQFQRYGLVLGVSGIAAGAVLCYWLRRGLDSFLFQVEASDPVVWIGACVLLLASAVLAAAIPSRRAASLDPMRVLRME